VLETKYGRELSLTEQLLDVRQDISRQTDINNLQNHLSALQGSTPLLSMDVDTRTVANVIADWTGVPLSSLMKAASLTLLAPVDQGYGIKVQQAVRVIQGVVSGFERLSTSKDETHYALTLTPRLALLSRSHQNAIYQDMSVPQIVEKILRERHNMRGQDFLFSLTQEYPRREQVMQYGEDDLRFITRLLGEVGIWFRFTTDTRLNIDVVEFYDSQQGYEKGLTLPSVPPSGQHSKGVDSVWGMECHHAVVQKQVSTRDYNYRAANEDMNTQVDATRGDATTYGDAYHYADNYLTPGSKYDRHPAPESGAFYARIRHERYLNGQTQTRAITSCPTLFPGMLLKVTGGYEVAEVFAHGVAITTMHTHARRDEDFGVNFEGIPDSPDFGFRPEPGDGRHASPVPKRTIPTGTSTVMAATASTCCSIAITGRQVLKACGCASPARMPVTPTACTCRKQAPLSRG